MTYRVLIVDDSAFFQVRLKAMIDEHPELTVCGIAANGREAIDMAEELKPDVISMDYEMPFMDGVTAIKAILAKRKVPIIMFSSMTYEGARVTLDALAAGAVDYIPKNFADVSRNSSNLKSVLHETLLTFARKSRSHSPVTPAHSPAQVHGGGNAATANSLSSPAATHSSPAATPTPNPATAPAREPRASEGGGAQGHIRRFPKNRIKLVVIGTSTGGPVALTDVLQKLPKNFPVPVVVIQHMPENFTKALAERLDKICQIGVAEAKDGDALQPGHVLIAPGGHQLMFDKKGAVKILPGDDRVTYKPSVDIAFASAANIYGANVLGVVMTGMGADGCEGARLLKQNNAYLWGQDQASCVVYGMPKAVAVAGLTDEVMSLENIGPRLAQDI